MVASKKPSKKSQCWSKSIVYMTLKIQRLHAEDAATTADAAAQGDQSRSLLVLNATTQGDAPDAAAQ